MTHDSDIHAPAPEFRAGLEAEIVRALHREEHASASRFWNPQRVRTISRLAAAVILGVVVGAAPAQVQDARQRDSLLTAAQADLKLAELRLRLVREEYDAATQRAETGVGSTAERAAAAAQLRMAEAQLMTVRLNIEEIQATASSPRDDIAAPAINGRDFVRERLTLEAAGVQRAMAAAEEAMRDAERRKAIGTESAISVQQQELEVQRARTQLSLLAQKMELRKRFLDSRLSAGETERELRTLELQHSLMLTQHRAAVAAERLKFVEERVKGGTAPRAELLRAELEALEVRAELERIQAQLRAVRTP
jgi:outer membrane protein TolC